MAKLDKQAIERLIFEVLNENAGKYDTLRKDQKIAKLKELAKNIPDQFMQYAYNYVSSPGKTAEAMIETFKKSGLNVVKILLGTVKARAAEPSPKIGSYFDNGNPISQSGVIPKTLSLNLSTLESLFIPIDPTKTTKGLVADSLRQFRMNKSDGNVFQIEYIMDFLDTDYNIDDYDLPLKLATERRTQFKGKGTAPEKKLGVADDLDILKVAIKDLVAKDGTPLSDKFL